MIRAGAAVEAGIDPGRVAETAVTRALERLGNEPETRDPRSPAGPAAALVVATAAWGDAIRDVVEVASSLLETPVIAGASVFGLVGGGRELEQNPAVGVLALAGVEAQAVLLEGLSGDEGRAGEDLADLLGGRGRPEDLVVVFPDSQTLLAESLAEGLRAEVPGATVLGVGATELPRRAPLVWAGGAVAEQGLAALVLRLPQAPRVRVAQGAGLVTDPMQVTSAQGNWILGLDGGRALDVYRKAAREPLGSDLPRAARSLLVAVPDSGTGVFDERGFRLRDVVGFDVRRGGLAIPQLVERGDEVALAHLDSREARERLAHSVSELQGPRSVFGLYLGCRTRGASLFGEPGLESGYLERLGTALLGITGPYQIAPLGPRRTPDVLAYAGALAVIDSVG